MGPGRRVKSLERDRCEATTGPGETVRRRDGTGPVPLLKRARTRYARAWLARVVYREVVNVPALRVGFDHIRTQSALCSGASRYRATAGPSGDLTPEDNLGLARATRNNREAWKATARTKPTSIPYENALSPVNTNANPS